MSKIYFIRHGQASFFSDNYDQLSPIGYEQTAKLGQFFREENINFDQVYCGTLARQQQSAQSCLSEMGCDIAPKVLPGLNEHQGHRVAGHLQPERYASAASIPPERRQEAIREFHEYYFSYAPDWASGVYDGDERLASIETWRAFRQRLDAAIAEIRSAYVMGSTVAIFTSGGTIGAAAGSILDLDSTSMIKLGYQVKNASFSEAHYSGERMVLSTFNETPHLDRPELRTMV